MTPSLNASVATIARAFAMGPLDIASLLDRGARAASLPARVLLPLAEIVAARFEGRARPRARDIVALLCQDRLWLTRQLAPAERARRRPQREWLSTSPSMAPVAAATQWALPALTTVSELAAWLELTTEELAWFSNCAAIDHQDLTAARHHYHYLLRPKPHGGVRVLEAPQPRLKALQRRILAGILDQVPKYWSVAHGFVKGRSVRTFAEGHVGRAVLLRVDLADFFPRISGARVQALFRTLGYPEAVADALGGICTNTTPAGVFVPRRWRAISRPDLRDAQLTYSRPHLPQGAPTSPALANLCAYRLDCRLTGLADWAGAVYSRYADDLAISGGEDVARRIEHYAAQIAAIASEEGWRVQHHKTRIMRQGAQQRLTGLVVNVRVNCPRRDVDTLRAILTNCMRLGPTSQNRDTLPDFNSHLRGRIAWVRSVNVAKAARLQAIFDRIDWTR
jgi:RNA-directed DNA polymerase